MKKFIRKMFLKKNLRSSQERFNAPQKLRVRIIKIVQFLVEEVVIKASPLAPHPFEQPANDFYQGVHDVLSYEFGEFNLGGGVNRAEEDILNFLLKTQNSEQLLKTIEYLFRFAYDQIFAYRNIQAPNERCIEVFNEIVKELNQNFVENDIGYQYESGRMIPVDSHFTHQEIIKPVLTILADSMYKGANAEFLSAYDHYQAGGYKESINECLKAFESCMKSICQKRTLLVVLGLVKSVLTIYPFDFAFEI